MARTGGTNDRSAKRSLFAAMLAAICAVGLVPPAASAATVRGCTASLVRVERGSIANDGGLWQANPAHFPCRNDYRGARLNRTIGPIEIHTADVEVWTAVSPIRLLPDFGLRPDKTTPSFEYHVNHALASIQIGSLSVAVGGNRITARGIHSLLACTETVFEGPPSLGGWVHIEDLVVNGEHIAVGSGDTPTIDLAGEGGLGIATTSAQHFVSFGRYGGYYVPAHADALVLQVLGYRVAIGEATMWTDYLDGPYC